MKAFYLIFILSCFVLNSFATAQKTVVIDAGHGGKDRGGLTGRYGAEKALTLDVARRVDRLLRDAGVQTVMTRKNDTFVSLQQRTAIANRYRNSIFVSIHFNATQRRGASGIETFYCGDASRSLANSVHRQVMRAVSSEDRGVKKRKFYVLRNTKSPAVLVECGFLTNPAEAKRCRNPAYRERLAQQITNGILTHLKIQTLPQPVKSPSEILAKKVVNPSRTTIAATQKTTVNADQNKVSEEILKRRFLIATGRIP